MSNLRSTADWNYGPRNSSISAAKWPRMSSSAGGCEPGPGTCGVIGDHLGETLAAQEIRHDDKFVGVALPAACAPARRNRSRSSRSVLSRPAHTRSAPRGQRTCASAGRARYAAPMSAAAMTVEALALPPQGAADRRRSRDQDHRPRAVRRRAAHRDAVDNAEAGEIRRATQRRWRPRRGSSKRRRWCSDCRSRSTAATVRARRRRAPSLANSRGSSDAAGVLGRAHVHRRR